MLYVLRFFILFTLLFQSGIAFAEMGRAAKPLLVDPKRRHVHTVRCRHNSSTLENLKDAGQAIDRYIGDVASCNRGPKNSFKVTCDKVQAADESSFNAKFDYNAKVGEPNYVGCSNQFAPEYVEALHLSDIAQAADQSVSCNVPFLKDYRDKPGAETTNKLNQASFEAFKNIQQRLRDKQKLQEAPQAQIDLTEASRGHGEDSKFPTLYYTQNVERAERNKVIVKNLDLEMAVLINQIPYGTDERVRTKMLELVKDPNVSLEKFVGAYRPVVEEIANDYQAFQAELQDPKVKKGDQYYLTPSLRARFMASPTYDELMKAKPNLDPTVKQVMSCRNTKEKKGKETYNKRLLVGSILAATATGGLSAAGVALTGAAKVAFVATDMALMGLGSATIVGQIYDSCYKDVTVIANGQKCSPEQGLNAVISKASKAACATNVVMGVAMVGGLAAMTVSKVRPVSKVVGEAEEVSLAAKVDDVASEADTIVVTGTKAKVKPIASKKRKIPCISSFSPSLINLVLPYAFAEAPCPEPVATAAPAKPTMKERFGKLLGRKPPQERYQDLVDQAVKNKKIKFVDENGNEVPFDLELNTYYAIGKMPDSDYMVLTLPTQRKGIHEPLMRKEFGTTLDALDSSTGQAGGVIFTDKGLLISGRSKNYGNQKSANAFTSFFRRLGFDVKQSTSGAIESPVKSRPSDYKQPNKQFGSGI